MTDRETITVHIWAGTAYESADELVETEEPDVYELPAADTEYGRPYELTDEERVLLAEAIEHHGTYAIDVPNEDRPATVNIHTNDSYHSPNEWGDPVERGLTFHKPDDREPFKCEMWGRVMMWAERPGEADD